LVGGRARGAAGREPYAGLDVMSTRPVKGAAGLHNLRSIMCVSRVATVRAGSVDRRLDEIPCRALRSKLAFDSRTEARAGTEEQLSSFVCGMRATLLKAGLTGLRDFDSRRCDFNSVAALHFDL
jgi:hypothetical protein